MGLEGGFTAEWSPWSGQSRRVALVLALANRALESRAEKEMKPVKKTKQDSSDRVTHTSASDEIEEEVAPSGAALIGILLTGLLYFALPPNMIIGPNWLLLIWKRCLWFHLS